MEGRLSIPPLTAHLLAAHTELQILGVAGEKAGHSTLFGLSKFQLDLGTQGIWGLSGLHSYCCSFSWKAWNPPAEAFQSAQGWVSIWSSTDG